LGDTHGKVVDETYQRDSPFSSAYDRTKYKAHQVAERLIDQGAPLVIVMPAAVYGPDDHSMLATFLRLILRRMLPIMPAADTGFSLVHVDDVARGHVLAAEKGQIGESYILGGDIMTAGDAFQIVARMAGVPAPLLLLDSNILTPLRPIANWLEKFVALPALLSSETLSTLGATWLADSSKAERELGYTHRSFEEGMAETITWEAARLHQQATLIPLHYQAAALATTLVALLILGIQFLRRRGSSAR
jgi:dihydroflavonol-4-reductase